MKNMVCRENVESLRPDNIIHHMSAKNADGTSLRGKVNGMVKLWKRYPLKFRLPMKYGIRTYFYITEDNAKDWYIPEKDK